MTEEQTRERIALLERRRKARDGKPGFEVNVAAIDEEIARLKSTL